MPGRIVLFGATGYTGELTARALLARGHRPVLAGRGRERLAALAADLGGLETQVADVEQPQTVRALVERGDVLITTVGPFQRHGRAALEAAVDAGAHYLDSTGEGPFIRAVFERHGRGARAAGSGVLTAFGYDWVPGNLAGALALHEAGEQATAVDVGYFVPGGGGLDMSGGTRASAAGIALEPAFAFRGGRLVTERPSARVRRFELGDGRAAPGVSLGTSEAFGLPRVFPELRDVGVYLGWFGAASRAMQVLGVTTSVVGRVPGVRAALGRATGRLVPGSSGGPDAAQRAKVGSLVVAEAFSAAGTRLAAVRLQGVNAYDFTAGVLAWGAERAAAGDLLETGALGPVEAFGLEALEAGVAEAGISRSA